MPLVGRTPCYMLCPDFSFQPWALIKERSRGPNDTRVWVIKSRGSYTSQYGSFPPFPFQTLHQQRRERKSCRWLNERREREIAVAKKKKNSIEQQQIDIPRFESISLSRFWGSNSSRVSKPFFWFEIEQGSMFSLQISHFWFESVSVGDDIVRVVWPKLRRTKP